MVKDGPCALTIEGDDNECMSGLSDGWQTLTQPGARHPFSQSLCIK